MIIRTLTNQQSQKFRQALQTHAQAEPLTASYTVSPSVDDALYRIKLQPERHNRVAVLHALRIRPGQANPSCELITRSNLLDSLLEILLDQGLPETHAR